MKRFYLGAQKGYRIKRKKRKMSKEQPEILNVRASDTVKTQDSFGKKDLKNKGIAATFHLTSLENYDKLVLAAWKISGEMGLPAVIVVRAPRKV